MEKQKNRNGLLELTRFIAAILMALYHFEWVYMEQSKIFTHTYIFVEFFFIISGFFIVKNVDSQKNPLKKNQSSCRYVFNQLKKLYIMYLLAFIFSFTVYIIINKISSSQIIQLLWNAKWEILLCNVFGFAQTQMYNLGGATTFIPALLFVTLIMHYLYSNYRNLTINVIIPIITICGISRIINVAGNLSQWISYDNFMTLGLIRAFADISVGMFFANKIHPYLKEKNKIFNLTLYFISITFCLALIIFRNYISYSDLILWIFIFGLLISETMIIYKPLSDKANTVMLFLGKLSFPIFMFHYSMILIFKKLYLKINIVYIVILFVIFTIIISYIAMLINDLFNVLINKKKKID